MLQCSAVRQRREEESRSMLVWHESDDKDLSMAQHPCGQATQRTVQVIVRYGHKRAKACEMSTGTSDSGRV